MHYRKTDILMIILPKSIWKIFPQKNYVLFSSFFERGGGKNKMRSASDGFGLAKYHYIPIKYSL